MTINDDLEIARTLIRAGIPIINWKAGYDGPPKGWPQAEPNLSVVDEWQPGDKLYIVTGLQASGKGIDIADVDPRNGGMESLKKLADDGLWPKDCGRVTTPSGGVHFYFPPSGTRKGIPAPGIDYQSGTLDSQGNHVGRGLAAIPPSAGSKSNPKGTYAWAVPINLEANFSHENKIIPLLRRSDPPRGIPAGPKINLTEEAREASNIWEEKYIQTKMYKKLAALLKKDQKANWDETVYGIARDMVRLINSPWSAATSETIRPRFADACIPLQNPSDPAWTGKMDDKCNDKFDRALIEVVDAVPAPAEVALLISEYAPDSLTDDGNATLFVDLHHDNMRYVPQSRTEWHIWNGHMWVTDDMDVVSNLARTVLRELPEGDKDLDAHKKHSLNLSGINNCINLAGRDPRIVVSQSLFDAQPMTLNTPAGVVDLLTGEMHEPDRHQYHSRVTSIAPDFTADHPMWDQFLFDTFQGAEQELVPFMQRMYGYSISGSVDFDFMPFLYGDGQNGKTVISQVLYMLLGSYAGVAPSGLLTLAKYNHETTKATLFGKRFVVVTEENENAAFNEARVKEYSGGEPLTARFVNRDDFTWTPTQKIWILANHKPAVKSGGDSFWRRVKLVDFPHKVPEHKKILGLEDKLVKAEGPAILAWAIRGAVEVFTNGLQVPESVELSTKAYAEEEDDIGRFLSEECNLGPDLVSSKKDLQAKYTRWCESNNLQPKNPTHLGRSLTKKGITAGGDGRKKYLGVELKVPYMEYPSLNPSMPDYLNN